MQKRKESKGLLATLQGPVQVGAGGMPMADAHHASHPPGMQSRGGGGGRKPGGRGRGSRPGGAKRLRHQNKHSFMATYLMCLSFPPHLSLFTGALNMMVDNLGR